MFKKATSIILGTMIMVSPLAVSAQTLPSIPPNASIEQLQQIVVQLTQMLQQLLQQIANRGEGTGGDSVDIKVSGLDGPVSIQKNTIASVSWKTSGMYYCEVRGNRGTEVIEKGLEQGSIDVRVNDSTLFTIKCMGSSGIAKSDSVSVTVTPPAYGPTCTYSSGSTMRTDDISLSSITSFESCRQSCTIVRNEKYGLRDSGFCSYVNSQGVSEGVLISPGAQSAAEIRVTAPNGGEQWEIGQLNTITWAPYSYTSTTVNGANDVTVYLEQKCGPNQDAKCGPEGTMYTVGKVMDQGKASLHTYFNIDSYSKWAQPGTYYVRAVNNKTGASDRSDAAFTLLPRGVDLKINDSDGPIQLYNDQPITIRLTAGTDFTSCSVSGARDQIGGNNGVEFRNVSTGTQTRDAYAYVPYAGGTSVSVYVICKKADGTQRSDTVQANIDGTPASVKIIYPNGGERVVLGEGSNVSFGMSGVQSYSAALYKNDQWMYWIVKDVPAGKEGFTWAPTAAALGPVNEAGQVFKIYITGKKSDGTGYVDDKSDAPFSFISNQVQAKPDCNIIYSPSVISPGQKLNVSWAGVTGTRTYTLSRNGVVYFRSANIPASGTATADYSELGGTGVITRTDTLTNAGGTATCTAQLTVASELLPTPLPIPTPVPSCTISYTPSVIKPGDTLSVQWASTNATSRSYTLTNTSLANDTVFFGPQNVSLSGSASYPYSDLASYGGQQILRTDTVTGPGGTARCDALLGVHPATSASANAPSQSQMASLASALAALEAMLKAYLAQ